MNSLVSLFSVLVCPIIVVYFLAMTYHGICDLIHLKKRNDEEAEFLKVATKKQTYKYIVFAVIFSILAIVPQIIKLLAK